MPDYKLLLDRCQFVNKMSATLIDEFLVYYAARQDKVEREFESRISRFKDIEKEMPSNWKGMIKAQYIGQRIFKTGGLIHKYLNSAAVKAVPFFRYGNEYLKIMSFIFIKQVC